MDSTFSTYSIERNDIQWEDHIYDLSPIEKVGNLWFKREDKFAPLGPGGLNGSKLRRGIWLIDEASKKGFTGVFHGAPAGSPQHVLVSAVAAHYNMTPYSVVGTGDFAKHEMLKIAAWMGSGFRVSNVGYVKTLEKVAHKEAAVTPNSFVYSTNVVESPQAIEAFHHVGSEQVTNIPGNIETLIIPAGSCNSVVSILYGLALHPLPNLKRVVLMGIGAQGSTKPEYIYSRLKSIEEATGLEIRTLFAPNFVHDKAREPKLDFKRPAPYELIHINVNKGCGVCELCQNGYCDYADLMECNYHGIDMHPRYEGKTFHFWKSHKASVESLMGSGDRLYWIIGSKPSALAMEPYLEARFGKFSV